MTPGSRARTAAFRSGARDDAYPTMKLDKGAQVTVVGLKFAWLKILPPEGSFAYVPKVYIERRGNGSVGRATRETIAKDDFIARLRRELKEAAADKRPVAIGAARHSMGGQSIPRDGTAITVDPGACEPDTAAPPAAVRAWG